MCGAKYVGLVLSGLAVAGTLLPGEPGSMEDGVNLARERERIAAYRARKRAEGHDSKGKG